MNGTGSSQYEREKAWALAHAASHRVDRLVDDLFRAEREVDRLRAALRSAQVEADDLHEKAQALR